MLKAIIILPDGFDGTAIPETIELALVEEQFGGYKLLGVTEKTTFGYSALSAFGKLFQQTKAELTKTR